MEKDLREDDSTLTLEVLAGDQANRSETELSFATRRQISDAEYHIDSESILRQQSGQEVRQTQTSRNVSSGYHSYTTELEDGDQSQTMIPLAADCFIEQKCVAGGQCEQGARPKTSTNDSLDENSLEDSSIDSETENADYKDQIIEHYRFLKDNLDADSALDVLVPFFSERDLEDINAIGPRYRKVDKMLQKLLRLPRGSDAFHALKESFETNGNSFINDELQKQVHRTSSRSLSLTTEEKRKKMRKYKTRLMDEIDPQYAHEFFLMRKAITLDDYIDIDDEPTSKQKQQLLEHIDRSLPKCFDVLIEYLLEKQQKETKDATVSRTNCLAFLLSRPWAEETTHTSVRSKTTKKSTFKRHIKRESNQRRPWLRTIKSGAEFKLHIILPDSEVSERVVECLNEAHIKLELNDELILLKSCSIKSSSSGSIVIWFKKFRDQVRNLFETDELAFITNITELIFNHRAVSAIIPRGNVKFDVQLELHKSSEKITVSISERIQCYRQFLIEELDGQKLLAYLRQRSDVSTDEERFIMKQTSRRSRLSAILDIVLRKEPSDLEDFRSYLEKYANSIYELMWPSIEKDTERYVTSMEMDLDQLYLGLVDRMQPSIFLRFDEDFHMPRPLVDELLRNPNKINQAKMILQHVLCQNKTTRRQFVQMLLFYQQLNRGDLQRPQRPLPLVHKRRNTTHIRRTKLPSLHTAPDRLPIQLGKFCLQSSKGVLKTPRYVQVASSSDAGTPLSHLAKSSYGTGHTTNIEIHGHACELKKRGPIRSTHIFSGELDDTSTHVDRWRNARW
ncbi:uncharacterized protein LOC128238523 isoform X2 [Mya arenaria]|uniref:uncharacterized protein LOC128238523 isoform X2 n=1 Tax=Mya arenaria TaxID=6604 RepID=UPI0022E1999C|nr:uncharacterized protein LOC128238523 isoform X2 [Mya arenaria]